MIKVNATVDTSTGEVVLTATCPICGTLCTVWPERNEGMGEGDVCSHQVYLQYDRVDVAGIMGFKE